MHHVIVRWLLITLCSECIYIIIDGKLSFPLNQIVGLKDYLEHMFRKMLRLFLTCSYTVCFSYKIALNQFAFLSFKQKRFITMNKHFHFTLENCC